MSETKKCKHCEQDKPISDYNKAGGGKWLQPYCKPCDSERKKKHYIENRQRYIDKSKTNYESTKILVTETQRIESRIRSNKALVESGRAYNQLKKLHPDEKKKRKSENDKRYREKNAEKVKAKKKEYQDSGRATEMAKKWQAKKRNDLAHVTKKRLRGRIYVALKRGIKSQSTMELLGCSIEHFKAHFESLFTDGMNWDRYMSGEIDIDHVKPCKHFDLTKSEEQKKCFFYENLQPLWHLDNLKKGTTYHEQKMVA